VACTWRIRHKLVLGMSLVTVIMALLLGGTLHGLASYRAAMGTCDRKLEEQDAAVEIQNKIRPLTDAPDRAQIARHIKTQIPKIESAINKYAEVLEETIARGRAPNDGKEALGFVGDLRKDLRDLDLAIEKEVSSPSVRRNNDPLSANSEIQKAIDRLDWHCRDLIATIGDDIAKMVHNTRGDAQKSIWLLCITGVAAVLVMTSLLRFFYRWVAQPIRDLELGVSRVARGDFQHRIHINSGDEIEDLAKAYNEMTDKLSAMYENLAQQVNERSRQLVRSERLAGVGFLAAGVAHEINNPLASIAFCSEALESRLEDLLKQSSLDSDECATIAKYLKMIQEEAFRCKEITQKLLAFSRGGERSREEADLVEVAQSVIDMVKHLQNCKGRRIDFAETAPMRAWVNAQEIKQVFLNLVVNALESMDEAGTLTIKQCVRDGHIESIFTDTGCGMTPEVLENIFEPFFTRSRTGKGTGLGLSISHRIIASHGGEIEASSDGTGKGSTFKIRLPIQPPANLLETGQDVQDPVEEFLKLSTAKRNAKAA